MDYGREMMTKQDWKQVFGAGELDKVIARMLRLDSIGAPRMRTVGSSGFRRP